VPESINRSEAAWPSSKTKHKQQLVRYDNLKRQKRDVTTKKERLQTKETELGEEMNAVRDEIVTLLDTDGSEK
jgi:hypothetical protein